MFAAESFNNFVGMLPGPLALPGVKFCRSGSTCLLRTNLNLILADDLFLFLIYSDDFCREYITLILCIFVSLRAHTQSF